jgi:hypothetical protein
MSIPRRFKHWAYLNDEGKKIYGDIFPDGEIPIVSMMPRMAHLGGGDTPSPIYMIRVDDLTPEQFAKILDLLTEKFKAPREAMEKDFRENGIPLRLELTSGAGSNQIGLFLPDYDENDREEYDDDDYEDEEDEDPW